MSGINGVYQFSGLKSIDKEVIFAMNNSSNHELIYHDDFVLFGNQSTTLIEKSKKIEKPFTDVNERYVVIVDGEIYNSKALKAKLPNYSFKTEALSELISAAYAEWGKKCVDYFDGVFAFSIWDKVEKSMYISRDRMGVKPLYYTLDHDKIIFSSSVKSILKSQLVEKRLRKESVVDYLRFQTVHAPYTIVEEVYSLMPAQYLYFTEEKQELETYWTPSKTFIYPDNELDTVQNKLESILSTSVEKRLSPNKNVGTFISNDAESAVLVDLMSRKHNQKVNTFSVSIKEDSSTDNTYLNSIAKQFVTNHHELELSFDEFKDFIPTALAFCDQPTGSALSSFLLSDQTKKMGLDVMLSSVGSNELFAGYPVFDEIPAIQSKKWLASFPNYARKYPGILGHMINGTVESSKKKEILKQEYFDSEYIYQFSRQILMDDQVKNLLTNSKLPLNRVFEITHDLIGYNTDGWALPTLSRLTVAEFSTFMQNSLLPELNQVHSASSLETKLPFLDQELIEYTLGVKDKFKKPVYPNKLLLESFKKSIEKPVQGQSTSGIELPYDFWMKGELKSFCLEYLNEIKKLTYINAKGVDSLWNAFIGNDKRVNWVRIWHLVVLGHWLKENSIEG